jgi:tetratricopeptide (TPR) repeat protein
MLVGAFSFITRSDHIRENDYTLLALAYEEQGRRDLAAPEYVSALEVDPHYSVARDKLVECYIALGQPDRALDTAIEGARLEPKSPETFLALARTFEEKGEPETAIRSLEWALVMNPQYVQARRELARLHEEQGNPEAALAQWMEVFKADPGDEEAIEKLKNPRPKPRRK